MIDDQVVQVPVVHASGTFGGVGNSSGTGDFYFLDNKNNPMMIQSTIRFSFEKNPRMERSESCCRGLDAVGNGAVVEHTAKV